MRTNEKKKEWKMKRAITWHCNCPTLSGTQYDMHARGMLSPTLPIYLSLVYIGYCVRRVQIIVSRFCHVRTYYCGTCFVWNFFFVVIAFFCFVFESYLVVGWVSFSSFFFFLSLLFLSSFEQWYVCDVMSFL